jgi:hypothetical protein
VKISLPLYDSPISRIIPEKLSGLSQKFFYVVIPAQAGIHFIIAVMNLTILLIL